jgi:hypothetical protein
MTFTDADLVRILIYMIGGSATIIVGALGWLGRSVIGRIGKLEGTLQREMRQFDSRITRVEMKLGLDQIYIKPID